MGWLLSMLRLMPMPVCCTAVWATAVWATPALAMVATATATSATPEPPTLPVTTVWPDTVTVLAMLPVPTPPPLTVTPGLTPLPPHTATGLPTVSGPDTCGKYLQFHKSLPLPQNLSNQNSPSATKLR